MSEIKLTPRCPGLCAIHCQSDGAEVERLRAYKVRYIDLRERVTATAKHVEKLVKTVPQPDTETLRDIASDLRDDLEEK